MNIYFFDSQKCHNDLKYTFIRWNADNLKYEEYK